MLRKLSDLFQGFKGVKSGRTQQGGGMGRSRQVSMALSESCYGACDPAGTRIVKRLAMDKAEKQLSVRAVHTETLHMLIAKFVALHPPDKPHTPNRKKKAVQAAMEFHGVKKRTVRDALRKAKSAAK
jgi:hypothetical protein